MFTKIKTVLKEQLTMGVTPEKISQSLVWGILIGAFPLLGFTTMLAALFGFIFKLNHIVIQTANYLMYPVQILLIPVYIKIVSLVFDVGYVPMRPDIIISVFKANPRQFLELYGMVGLYAVVLWCLLSAGLYFVLYPVILKTILKIKNKRVRT